MARQLITTDADTGEPVSPTINPWPRLASIEADRIAPLLHAANEDAAAPPIICTPFMKRRWNTDERSFYAMIFREQGGGPVQSIVATEAEAVGDPEALADRIERQASDAIAAILQAEADRGERGVD